MKRVNDKPCRAKVRIRLLWRIRMEPHTQKTAMIPPSKDAQLFDVYVNVKYYKTTVCRGKTPVF
jgi:hypothetical protein